MSVTIIAIHLENGDGEPELVEHLYPGLLALLPEDSSWWIAEDERSDRSDCDSAVFVPMGRQAEARALLRAAGLAH